MSSNAIRAVVFLDMSGYTALTEAHGDHSAARLAEGFTRLTRAHLSADDWLVKSIGDAVLFTCPTPTGALASLARVIEATHRHGPYPVLRAGVHYGPVVQTDDDIYGSTVNIASRLAATAGPGQTLGTDAVAAAAETAEISFIRLGPIHLRNVAEPICVYAIGLDSDCHYGQIDPVCRMRVPPNTGVVSRHHAGSEYSFCSSICEQQFAARPELFSGAAR